MSFFVRRGHSPTKVGLGSSQGFTTGDDYLTAKLMEFTSWRSKVAEVCLLSLFKFCVVYVHVGIRFPTFFVALMIPI